MARNGSGTMQALSNSWSPPVVGQLATSGDWQAIYADLISALTQSLSRDGQGGMIGNLPMNNNKITGLSDGTGTGQAVSFAQLFNQGTEQDLASAATTDIGAQLTNFLRITGTTTITSFGTNYKGPRFLRFESAVTLTNSSTLILPGGANITTAAGDCCIAIPKATLGTADGWQVVAYQKNAVPGAIADGSVTTAKIAANAVTPAKMANGGAEFGMRNRLINGAMMIDQRNAGASVTPANGAYTLDRWIANLSQTSKFTVQRNAGSVTPPAGFSNYMGVTSSSAYSVLTGDYFLIRQYIEGFNFADMAWGTASAATVTLSFWVRSSLTGTFGGSIQNSASDRSYPFSYTINAANTWEQKSITIAGDTSGTWVGATNGVGLIVGFSLGSGSTFSGTAGSWQAANLFTATGATSVVGTSGATFYITGVQLEKGSTATSFDYRPYGTELALCQRYAFVSVGGSSIAGAAPSSTVVQQRFVYPVSMRSAPTATVNTAGSWGITDDYFSGHTAASFGLGASGFTTEMASVNITGFSGLTTGRSYFGAATGTGKILFSSEL